jgi:hypothetical protein
MRKPDTSEKFRTIIQTMSEFYGRRDKKMVLAVLQEELEKRKREFEKKEGGDKPG